MDSLIAKKLKRIRNYIEKREIYESCESGGTFRLFQSKRSHEEFECIDDNSDEEEVVQKKRVRKYITYTEQTTSQSYSAEKSKSSSSNRDLVITDKSANSGTVVSVCNELLKILEFSSSYRARVSDLMMKALDFEKSNAKEYCMTSDECEFLMSMKGQLNALLKKKRFSYSVAESIKEAKRKIFILANRWMVFTCNGKRSDKTNAPTITEKESENLGLITPKLEPVLYNKL